MLADFEHCFSSYMYSDKQTHWETEPLRLRGHKVTQHQLNKHLTKKSGKNYFAMKSRLHELREELATKIGLSVEQGFEGKEVEQVYNILIETDLMLDKVRTERHIIAIYDMIAKRLKEVTYKYKPRIRTGYVLYRLAEIIHESIKEHLPHRVYEIDLAKIIWPHNCDNLNQMKSVFYEYVMYNTSLLGSSQSLAIVFLSQYENQIKNADDLHKLREIYEDIQVTLIEIEHEDYRKGEYRSAWEAGVINSVIHYMHSDFQHC